MTEQLDEIAPDGDERDSSPAEPPAEMGPADIVMLLISVPERLADLLSGLTPAQLGYRHGPAFPTAAEVAEHLLVSGGELDSTVTSICLGTEPAHGSGEPRALAEQLDDWQRHRRRSVDLLRGLPPEGWDRPVLDETLIAHCRRQLGHELSHLSQLRTLSALLPIA